MWEDSPNAFFNGPSVKDAKSLFVRFKCVLDRERGKNFKRMM